MPNGAFTELNQETSDDSNGNLGPNLSAEVWKSEQADKELCCPCGSDLNPDPKPYQNTNQILLWD